MPGAQAEGIVDVRVRQHPAVSAEIEQALGCESLKDLSVRLKAVSARDLHALLAALLRGGGEAETASRLNDLPITPQAAIAAVLACFRGATP